MKYLILLVVALFLTACDNPSISQSIVQSRFPNATVVKLTVEENNNQYDFLVIDSNSVSIVGCHHFTDDGISSIVTYKK